MKIKVYSGLSLSRKEIRKKLPRAVISGPIRAGDLVQDIKAGFHVVVIIDGVFYQDLAVTPSEIMDALRVGIRVFGCSSMGALRAVELKSYGMQGDGAIFEYISNAKIFDDDFLGQLFFEDDCIPLERAFVDLAICLDSLYKNGEISKRQLRRALEIGRSFHFSERTHSNLITHIKSDLAWKKVGSKTLDKIVKCPNLKRKDALGLLSKIARLYATRNNVRMPI